MIHILTDFSHCLFCTQGHGMLEIYAVLGSRQGYSLHWLPVDHITYTSRLRLTSIDNLQLSISIWLMCLWAVRRGFMTFEGTHSTLQPSFFDLPLASTYRSINKFTSCWGAHKQKKKKEKEISTEKQRFNPGHCSTLCLMLWRLMTK